MNHPKWQPVTERDVPEDKGLDFTLTPAERDIAVLARIDIIAMQREYGRKVEGLDTGTVAYADLSAEERRSFGL